ncbi:MAG TPA: NUDIX domain-containing protein [Solirubrobacteraceae bacterium]|nr:NUDIX domain-containing protein [Solirubrobacteraceae bacterium]
MSSRKPRGRRRKTGHAGARKPSSDGEDHANEDSGKEDPVKEDPDKGGGGKKGAGGAGGAGSKRVGSRRGGSGKGAAAKAGSARGATAKGSTGSGAGSGRGGSRRSGAGSSGSAKGGSAKGGSSKGASTKGGPRRGSARERSAGGVVVRGDEVVVIVPTRRASDGSKVVGLPKGHIDPGESPLEAATREVREETGIVAEPITELGETRYWYRRGGQTIPKSVSFYLFEYVGGSTDDHDDEVEMAWWMGLEDALTELSHAAEREMVARAVAYLEAESKER